MVRDYGFAPNPFAGFCTLATCKPKIRNTVAVSDWIMGTGGVTTGLEGRLIYLMEVNEVISFNDYWNEERFWAKRPVLNGSLSQIHGDNIYHANGEDWIQEDSHHSLEGGALNEENLERDLKSKNVAISYNFYYFGDRHIKIPNRYSSLACAGRDFCKHDPAKDILVNDFINHITKNFDAGVIGDPIDWADYYQGNLELE